MTTTYVTDKQFRAMMEAEAWRTIAEKFATGTQHYKKYGVCAEIKRLEVARKAPYQVTEAMYKRCYGYVGNGFNYAYGRDSAISGAIRNDEGRALACLWLALEAEEEAGL